MVYYGLPGCESQRVPEEGLPSGTLLLSIHLNLGFLLAKQPAVRYLQSLPNKPLNFKSKVTPWRLGLQSWRHLGQAGAEWCNVHVQLYLDMAWSSESSASWVNFKTTLQSPNATGRYHNSHFSGAQRYPKSPSDGTSSAEAMDAMDARDAREATATDRGSFDKWPQPRASSTPYLSRHTCLLFFLCHSLSLWRAWLQTVPICPASERKLAKDARDIDFVLPSDSSCKTGTRRIKVLKRSCPNKFEPFERCCNSCCHIRVSTPFN